MVNIDSGYWRRWGDVADGLFLLGSFRFESEDAVEAARQQQLVITFVEVVCGLFDDVGLLDRFIHETQNMKTDVQVVASLRRFGHQLRAELDRNELPDFKSAAWHAIAAEARAIASRMGGSPYVSLPAECLRPT